MSSSDAASPSLTHQQVVSCGFIPLRVRSDPSNPTWPTSPPPSESDIDVYIVLQHGGSLSFPKGRCEDADGGSYLTTAKRELEEETGLNMGELLMGETLFTDSYTFKRRGRKNQDAVLIDKTLHLFLATTIGEHRSGPSSESAGGKWMTIEEAKAAFAKDGTKTVLAQALDALHANGKLLR